MASGRRERKDPAPLGEPRARGRRRTGHLAISYILSDGYGVTKEVRKGNDTPIILTADVRISRLRSKLETDISNPELILTDRGIGYMFQNRLKFL